MDTSISISILDSISIPFRIPSIGATSIFTASLAISIIVSIPNSKAVCTKSIEPKAQPCMRLLSGKEIEEDIDLDEEIDIPKLDFDNATTNQMQLASQFLHRKEK